MDHKVFFEFIGKYITKRKGGLRNIFNSCQEDWGPKLESL